MVTQYVVDASLQVRLYTNKQLALAEEGGWSGPEVDLALLSLPHIANLSYLDLAFVKVIEVP